MIDLIRKITIVFAAILICYIFYEGFIRDSGQSWKNFQKPQLAAYTSLEQDEEILKELEKQTRFNSFKPLDPSFFVKPNIFQTIEK